MSLESSRRDLDRLTFCFALAQEQVEHRSSEGTLLLALEQFQIHNRSRRNVIEIHLEPEYPALPIALWTQVPHTATDDLRAIQTGMLCVDVSRMFKDNSRPTVTFANPKTSLERRHHELSIDNKNSKNGQLALLKQITTKGTPCTAKCVLILRSRIGIAYDYMNELLMS